MDFDGDTVPDSIDMDDDNDGILDYIECNYTPTAPAAVTGATKNSWTDTSGYSIYNMGGQQDGSGPINSGFQEAVTKRGYPVTRLNGTNNFSVANNVATFDDGNAAFTNGTVSLTYSGVATTLEDTTDNASVSGSTGDGLRNNSTIDTYGNGYTFSFLVDFDTPVYAFSFDLVDIYDTDLNNAVTIRKEIFVDGHSIGYFAHASTGDDDAGTVINFYNPNGTVRFSQIVGNNIENTFGIISKTLIDKVEIRTTYSPGGGYREPSGLDNFMYSGVPCSNSTNLDSDNDGCPDVIEGGANFVQGETYITGNALNTTVDANGVPAVPTATPAITGYTQTAGQTVGDSQNAAVNACVCLNPVTNTAPGVPTNHGITLLKRAGADNGNWPMIRKSAHTVLESNTKGFVITRIAKANLGNITNPVEGMMVYDTTDKCLKLYDGTQWSCFKTPACP